MTLLRNLRHSKGFTQQQLAIHLEISPEYVSRLENGNRKPSWDVQQRLERFFGIPASELLAEEEEENEKPEIR
ncbi:MAG TPA: transcriptional regulator [Syntrophomonas sp.]|jgi:putative transcriptional regulator|nr:transcriptional regulator [Syntrophomonas sp.]